MKAIMKREFFSYFTTPVGYIVLAVFWFFSGMYFTSYCISSLSSSLTSVFGNCFFVILFIVPLMTMRSFSEDKRRKTDQLLFTSPVSFFKIITGKFLGAFLMYCVCMAIFVVYAIVISFFGDPNWTLFISTMLGTLLFGAALISIGIFISSLTENQIIAAIATLAAGILIYMIDSLAAMINTPWIMNLLLKLSFVAAYSNFSVGLINLSDIVFDLSAVVLFLFFTSRILNRRRRA